MKLDAYDHRILAALQRDGRLSNVQLAEEIGLSPSPACAACACGVIRGYQASIDRDEVGLGLTVFVGIRWNATARSRPRPSTVRWSTCRR